MRISKRIKIPIEDYERLERIASKMNKTPEEALEKIILKNSMSSMLEA